MNREDGERNRARVPLFDRLIDLSPREQRDTVDPVTGQMPFRVLDAEGQRESVRRELNRLFNTRCPFPVEELERAERTVIDYGIPDFSHFSPHDPEDRRRLVASLAAAIGAYEPRLREVRVTLEHFSPEDQGLSVLIEAHLKFEEVEEPVSFRIPENRGAIRVDVRE